jgi:anaerobic selenocysteine-containing dehydrogenase
MRSLIALVALTGNLGVPGGGWVYANLQTQVFGGVRDPIAFYPPGDAAGSGGGSRPSAKRAA